jgi:oligoendopeptidase F
MRLATAFVVSSTNLLRFRRPVLNKQYQGRFCAQIHTRMTLVGRCAQTVLLVPGAGRELHSPAPIATAESVLTGVPERDQVPESDKWDLTRLYTSNADWERDLKACSGPWEKLLSFKGRVTASPETVFQALEEYLRTARVIERVYTYAHLLHDQDLRDDVAKNMYARAVDLHTRYAEQTSFLEPELVQLPDSYLEPGKGLEPYKHYLERIRRQRAHTLSAAEEALLAASAKATAASARAFSAMNDADFDFGSVQDSQGKSLTLSHGSYGTLMRSKDRILRQNAFTALHQRYRSFENTLAELLAGAVETHVFHARARRYHSSLEAALSPNAIPVEVYQNLLNTVRKHGLAHHHRYVALRRRLLDLEKTTDGQIHMYDMYAPLIPDVDLAMPYEAAVESVLASLAPLGEEYVRIATAGLCERRWVDRYENRGKRSGAYSSGCYDSEPYILHNYDPANVNDAFTLAHELGHSMHSYFSRRHQPYHYADYSIFVAEVASTFNEELYSRYLFQTKAGSRAEKAYLVNRSLEDLRGTLFRQAMFADFELRIHQMAEEGEPLTPAALRRTYRALNEEWFGTDAVCIDESIEWELFRIPHFYYNFYVYQYATGISAALALAERVMSGGPAERDAYLAFLSAGSSVDPIDALRIAGVDMTDPAPVQAALQRFGVLVDELDALTR